ncbi:GD17740 [Drosophila simulans]|uniref:GD17740 n=1 Tax=Drosophila simulans TaxID=7240 RepID=B4NSX8_DROSI|nr:GD17740 [Drosophila simulans]
MEVVKEDNLPSNASFLPSLESMTAFKSLRSTECFAFGDKKSCTLDGQDYMKKELSKMEEKLPGQVDIFKTNMNKAMKDILGRFKEVRFFTGEFMD